MTEFFDTMNANHPFFFVIGPQKCGTTLVAKVLDQHPNIACICEGYLSRPFSGHGIWSPQGEKHGFTWEQLTRWASRWTWKSFPKRHLMRLGEDLTHRHLREQAFMQRTTAEILETFAQQCNAQIVGDKWPFYIEIIRELTAVFPEAKYIHVVRDPRALWLSAQNFKGRQRGDEILAEVLQKESVIASYLARDNFMVVRHEDVVGATRGDGEKDVRIPRRRRQPAMPRRASRQRPLPGSLGLGPQLPGPHRPKHSAEVARQTLRRADARIEAQAEAYMKTYDYQPIMDLPQ